MSHPRCPMFCANPQCVDTCQYQQRATYRIARRQVYMLPPVRIDHDEALALAAYVTARNELGHRDDHGDPIDDDDHQHLDDTARHPLDLLLDRYDLDGIDL